MKTEVEELTERISNLSDDDLVKMLLVDHESYRDDALDVGRREFDSRKLGSLQECAQRLRSRPPDPPRVVDVSRDPTTPGTTWPGFAIAGLLLILEIVHAFVSAEAQPSIRVASAILSLSAFLVWLGRVDRLHRVLRRATQGSYPISALSAVVSHLVPLFNCYWVFRWTNEVVRFVNARDPSRKMLAGWPGALLLVGILSRFVDAALAVLLFFGVLAILSRRVERVVGPGAPPKLDGGWSSSN